MSHILDQLQGHFVIANLGAAGDPDFRATPEVLNALTLIELDGGLQPTQTSDRYHAKHRISHFVSGRGGTRSFFERAFWACCGLSPAKPAIVAKYGLEPFYQVRSTREVATVSVAEVLRSCRVPQVDFLKTDLEGLDFEVLESLGDWLPNMLAVQCELRFDPIYEDEPPFEAAVPLLRRHRFELVGLRPEFWKPKHPEWAHFVDGNPAWGDFLFMREPASVLALAASTKSALPLIKHVLLAVLLGKVNHALRLLQEYRAPMGAAVSDEVVQVISGLLRANPAYQGPIAMPNFPHVADPTRNVK